MKPLAALPSFFSVPTKLWRWGVTEGVTKERIQLKLQADSESLSRVMTRIKRKLYDFEQKTNNK